MEKIRILHIIDSLRSGGKERQLVNLLIQIAPLNEVHLFIADADIELNDVYGLKLNLYILPFSRKSLRYFKFLKKYLRDNKIELVHTWDAVSTITCLLPALICRTRIINGSIRGSGKVNTLSKRFFLERIIFLFSDMNIANSRAGLNATGFVSSRFLCIHNGFIPQIPQRRKDEIKLELGIDDSNVIVGMVSNFRVGKDYRTFFEGALRLINVCNDICFIAIGGGPLLNNFLHDYGSISDRLKILGYKNCSADYINTFDIGVLLSYECVGHGEGISNSIMEYMSFGLPVIASNSGGNGEIVMDGETGLLVSEKSVDEFITAVTTLISDRILMKNMGHAGKRRLTEHFSIQQMVTKTLNVYKLTLHG